VTTKLVSMNVGVILELEVNGKPEKVQFSAVCPRGITTHPVETLDLLAKFLNDSLGTGIAIEWDGSPVPIAKPKKIKAKRPISQKEFNRRIKELVP